MVDVSVIIPSMNEVKYIQYPFNGLAKQSYKNFETIVVDGFSKDGTRELASKYAKVIDRAPNGMGDARNVGAKAANGKLLVFLDADTLPSPDLLKHYVNSFGEGVIAATGPIKPLEEAGLATRLGYQLVSEVFVRATLAFGMASVVGSNFAIKKDAFDKIGGFDPHLKTYEDWDLSERAKKLGKIAFVKGAHVYTSTRRIKAWGVHGYFGYHVGNMLRYRFLKKPKEHYEPIR